MTAAAGTIPGLMAVLSRSELFHAADPASLALLAGKARERSWQAGEHVFHRGDPAGGMLLIVTGQVRIARTSPDGREHLLRILRPGDLFGEFAMFDGLARTADAVASRAARLLIIDRVDLRALVERDHAVALGLIDLLCRRLRSTDTMLEAMVFHDATARLAAALLSLAPALPGARVAITQQALGEMAGVSRETANKKLREWQDQGLLTLEQARITVDDPDRLRRCVPRLD